MFANVLYSQLKAVLYKLCEPLVLSYLPTVHGMICMYIAMYIFV